MSAVSGIGNSAIYQYLQATQASQSTQSGVSGSSSASSASSVQAAINNSGSSKAHGSHRHQDDSAAMAQPGGTGGSQRMQQLQNAVVTALQTAKANPSSDSNDIVQSAIASIFKNSMNASAPQAAGTDADGDDDGSATAASDTDTEQSTFFDTLQQYGIDPQQFQQDFQTAVQQAQGGEIDSSTAFQSFPPGVIVDTTA
ncbi:MAG TPA: hypothetical protein VGG19_11395 [Tepidisphaeraceae bacterium]|jgi:hypothetical protein